MAISLKFQTNQNFFLSNEINEQTKKEKKNNTNLQHDSLTDENEKLRNQISKLEKSNRKLSTPKSGIKKLQTIKKENEELKTENSKNTTLIKELQDRISQMENDIFNKEEIEKEHQLLILNRKSCSVETEEDFHLLNESLADKNKHLEDEIIQTNFKLEQHQKKIQDLQEKIRESAQQNRNKKKIFGLNKNIKKFSLRKRNMKII
jgi:chromosome segregation ATPase